MKTALLLCMIGAAFAAPDPALGRGFGDKYAWYNLQDGLQEAKDSNKPIMMVQHKSWCGMCKRFGPEFAKGTAIQKESTNFVMVNCYDDDEGCGDAAYQPDGGYIPRILFLTPEGKLRPELKVPNGNPKYLYFYSSPDQVVQTMKEAAKGSSEEL